MHIHGTILTAEQPAGNFRGEGAGDNITPLQKLSVGDEFFAITSSLAIRSALRESPVVANLPRCRERCEGGIEVKYIAAPDANVQYDTKAFGGLILKPRDKTSKKGGKKEAPKEDADAASAEEPVEETLGFRSTLQVNHAVALRPFAGDMTFHQSPRVSADSVVGGTTKSGTGAQALFNQETSITSFQYPFHIDANEFVAHKEWGSAMLMSFIEPNYVSNQARSLYYFDPKSLLVRVTNSRTPEYEPYCFSPEGTLKELDRLLNEEEEDLPAHEFWLSGAVVRTLRTEQPEVYSKLQKRGVRLFSSPRKMMEALSEFVYGVKVVTTTPMAATDRVEA